MKNTDKQLRYKVLVSLLFLIFFGVACKESSFSKDAISSSLPVKRLWQSQLEVPLSAGPILGYKVIVVQTSAALYGLDKNSGQQLWRHTFNTRQPSPVPIVVKENLLFFGDVNGMVMALDVDSGRIKWQQQHCGKENGYYTITSIVADQEKIYVASQPTAIEAIYLNNGSVSWKYCELNNTIFPPRGARLFIGADKDETVYVVTTEVHVLNRSTGIIEQVFKQNLAGARHLNNKRFYGSDWVRNAHTMELISTLVSPSYKPFYGNCEEFRLPFTFNQNHMYATGRCGGVFALDLNSYNVTESYFQDLDIASPVAMYKNSLYLLTSNGEIYAIDPVAGSDIGVLHTNKGVKNLSASSSGVVSDDEILVVTFGDRDIYVFKAD